MTIEEKLQYFKKYAMEDARTQSARQLDEYTDALEKIFREHQEVKRRQDDLQIKAETEQIIRENNKDLSQEQMQIKRMLRQKEDELKEKLFVEVEDRLGRFMDTPEYSTLLVKWLKEALDFAGGDEIILYIDPADSGKKMELESRIHAAVTISQYSFIGGMRAVIPSRNILIDQSFETKLAEEKDAFVFKGGDIRG